MKAPFAYFGGKMAIAQRIVAMMPPHRVYIEPFFGSGAVLFAKPPSRFEIVNDIDGAVVNFYRVMRERLTDLDLACALSPYARYEFENADLDADIDVLEWARRFWVRTNQSVTKSGTGSGWSTSVRRNGNMPTTILTRIGRFADVVDRLAGVIIENRDAATLIANIADETTVIYADPPYLASTRVGSPGQGRDYRADTSTEADHKRLAEVLTTTPAKVLLSGYPSRLYDSLYAGWDRVEIDVASHGGRREVVWCNFDRVLTAGVQLGLAEVAP